MKQMLDLITSCGKGNNLVLKSLGVQCFGRIKDDTKNGPMEGHWKFRGGGGSLKQNVLKESMKLIPKGGGGVKPQNLPWWGDGYSLQQHNNSC